MRIIILNNFFNYYITNFPKYKVKSGIFSKYYKKYNNIRLERLINKLQKGYGKNVELKIISSGIDVLNVKKNVEIQSLSDFRVKIDRSEFIKIREKVTSQTKKNLINLFRNLIDLKTFHIESLFIGKIMEIDLIWYLSKICGEFELLKKILHSEEYDKAILFNYNPNSIEFIKQLTLEFKNIILKQDSILKRINKSLKWYFLYFLNLILKSSLIGGFEGGGRKSDANLKSSKKNIIFFGSKTINSNLHKAVKPLYDYLNQYDDLNLIFYKRLKNVIPLKLFFRMIKIIFQIRKIWFKNQDKIFTEVEYDSINLNYFLNEFFNMDLSFFLVRDFFASYRYHKFFKTYPPSVVIMPKIDDMGARRVFKTCRLNKIPTISVPHSSIPDFKEISLMSDVSYITVSGENEKEYYIRRGEPSNKVIITGRMAYESFYNRDIRQLYEIIDMFDKRKYKFEPNKFTILLTTNPVENVTNEKIITCVVNSLKKLNLIDNLILKIHPKEDGIFHRKVFQKLNVNPIIVRDYN
ncbi:MAG: hypothetical protein ACFFBP_22945, partial [Promethearchaeota archaeon]